MNRGIKYLIGLIVTILGAIIFYYLIVYPCVHKVSDWYHTILVIVLLIIIGIYCIIVPKIWRDKIHSALMECYYEIYAFVIGPLFGKYVLQRFPRLIISIASLDENYEMEHVYDRNKNVLKDRAIIKNLNKDNEITKTWYLSLINGWCYLLVECDININGVIKHVSKGFKKSDSQATIFSQMMHEIEETTNLYYSSLNKVRESL